MGKANKRRACPAVGREISSAECGENRHSAYACPAECPHNPFAREHYSRLLELEHELDGKTVGWLLREAPDQGVLEREIQRAMAAKSGHATHAFFSWRLFFARDAAGATCAERWERAGFPGLANDERVFLRAKMRTRVALLEIHRVIDADQVEAVDLLAPGEPPRRIVDRGLAARAGRFEGYVAWCYPLPHFWRMSGTAIKLPEMGGFSPDEIVGEIARQLGAPAEGEAAGRWRAENFVRIDEALTATAHERRRRMLTGIDAQWGVATYALEAPPAGIRKKLGREPAVADDELSDKERAEGFSAAWVWLDDPAAHHAGTLPAGGRAVVGRVLLGNTSCRIEAMGAARLARLRSGFEARLGSLVKFTSERRDDLGVRMALEEPVAAAGLVPPRLLEKIDQLSLMSSRVRLPVAEGAPDEMIAGLRRESLKAFPDETIPALGGRTPREAAADAALRPALLRLVKSRMRSLDAENLRTGGTDDINWLVRELGLVELDFPPPPRRATVSVDLPDEDAIDDEDETADAFPAVDPTRPKADPLPDAPLSLEEAGVRMDAALAGFDTAAAAMDELEASGSELLDVADRITADHLAEEDFQFLITFLLHAWFTLVPVGRRAPVLSEDAMCAALVKEIEAVPRWLSGGSKEMINGITAGCRQPALIQILVAEIFEGATKAPKVMRPPPESLPVLIAVVKVVVNELHDALRR
ncbi:MAG: hypothetical protein ABIQ12_01540 [Opitutaceae bacterium]